MHDLIERQDAIDAFDEIRHVLDTKEKQLTILPSAQPETHEERTETHACDLISRQAAIDAILAVTGNSSVRELYEHVQEHGLSDMWSGGVNAAIDIIIAVPSVQTESKETSSTHKALDTISRQAAIDAMEDVDWYHINSNGQLVHGANSKEDEPLYKAEDVYKVLNDIPSAQPEWNNHTVACMLAELFDDTCACNYNGIDEWLPSKCELLDSCPNPVGVACWEQYLTHRAERRTDEM